MKREVSLLVVAIAAVCASSGASAHAIIGVYLGVPGPVYAAPPPVYYQAPPQVIYQAPPVVYGPPPGTYEYGYGYGYGYRGDGWDHRGWKHHRRHDDDDD
jgi:hypothetical protein